MKSYKIIITMAIPSLIYSGIFFFRSSNEGLKTDVLLKFQFVSNDADTVKRQADNILLQKLRLNESFLKTDTSSPYLRGKKYHFSSLDTVYHFNNLLIYGEIFFISP